MDKPKDSWSFLPRNRPWGKFGILYILAISCSDSHTRVHGYNFTHTHTHTFGWLVFVYMLHLSAQDDNYMSLSLICAPKQESFTLKWQLERHKGWNGMGWPIARSYFLTLSGWAYVLSGIWLLVVLKQASLSCFSVFVCPQLTDFLCLLSYSCLLCQTHSVLLPFTCCLLYYRL